MYSPKGSEGGRGSFPRGRGEEEAAFSRSKSQRMQNKLRNVCLDAFILKKKTKEEIRQEGCMWTYIPLTLREYPASMQLEEKGDWRACAAVSNAGTDSQAGTEMSALSRGAWRIPHSHIAGALPTPQPLSGPATH